MLNSNYSYFGKILLCRKLKPFELNRNPSIKNLFKLKTKLFYQYLNFKNLSLSTFNGNFFRFYQNFISSTSYTSNQNRLLSILIKANEKITQPKTTIIKKRSVHE